MPTERLPVIRPGLVLGKDCDDILNYNNKKKNKRLCFNERSIIRTKIVFCRKFSCLQLKFMKGTFQYAIAFALKSVILGSKINSLETVVAI